MHEALFRKHHSVNTKNVRLSALAGLLVCGLASSSLLGEETMPEVETACIVVKASETLGPVNTRIFGHNLSAGDGAGIFPSGTQERTIMTADGLWDPGTGKAVPKMAELAEEVGISMMRYPGGCLAHNYDWRETVGPVEQRGHDNWRFGLDEYLAFCEELGVEPVITVSDYVLPAEEMPQHAAELVEYLNAPATPEHPWAMRRKEWGHPEPYGVGWFELGNESEHGNHDVSPHRVYTPEQYADYAVNTARAMKAVDPSIKVGVVMVPGAGQDVYCDWNETVARIAGPVADFVVVHIYTPKVVKDVPISPRQEVDLIEAMMGAPEQIDYHLKDYRRMIEEQCGRALPLAVTEFNIGAVTNVPRPYRFTYGAALECADLMRVFLRPENGVIMAQYWQLANGYWGMLDSTGPLADPTIAERPAFPVFRLFTRHVGETLVETEVDAPLKSSAGYLGVYPADADEHEPGGEVLAVIDSDEILQQVSLNKFPGEEVSASLEDGTLTVTIDGLSKSRYPAFAVIDRPAGIEGPCDYRFSYEARFIGEPDKPTPPATVGLMDKRGYDQTGSALRISGGTAHEWTEYSGIFNALVDAPGVTLLTRLEGGGGLTGTLQIRNMRLEVLSKERFTEYPLLTAMATLSGDGETATLIVINKSETQAIQTDILLDGFEATSARLWQVNAPDLLAQTGVSQTQTAVPLALDQGDVTYVFPAHSITAIEFLR